jgi:DNA-binding winged helix-turn-helix (wHTH) protein/thioredoxin-like negative regulator of GroEL
MRAADNDDRVFEFGDFTLSPKERLLLHAGEPVALTSKAFDLLVALVRRSGHLVSKDELLREVWPDTFVQEVNLTVNISALRKALRQDQNDAGPIRTVSAHGYRFVAPVIERSAAVTHQIGRVTTANADAYRAYLQGRNDWSRRSEQALKRAAERFQHAVALDPGFAAAYAGLADCYATMGSLSYLAPTDAFPVARRYATRALELDPSLAEAHASLGFVQLYFDWNWPAADAEFQRSIALDPGYPATRQWYGIYLMAAARPTAALAEMHRARQRDPLSLPINTDIGFCHYYAGQYEEATRQLQFVLELSGDFAPAHLWLGRTYQELGRYDDAIAAFRHVEDKLPEWPVPQAARGFVEAIAGRTDDALATLGKLKSLSERKFVTSYGLALVYAALGETDAAFTWLDRAFAERSHWLVWLRLDPRWKTLRFDRRFAECIKHVGYPE